MAEPTTATSKADDSAISCADYGRMRCARANDALVVEWLEPVIEPQVHHVGLRIGVSSMPAAAASNNIS